jgi:hypothetical protein
LAAGPAKEMTTMELAGFLTGSEPPPLPKRSLFYDEIETFPQGKVCPRFRIRIWAGKEATPIVLVTQTRNGPHPRSYATRIANYINEAVLRYPSCGFIFFEDGVVLGQPYLTHVDFEYFGHSLRLKLYRPTIRPRDWEYLEHVLGGKIER